MTKKRISKTTMLTRVLFISGIIWFSIMMLLVGIIHITGTVNEPIESDAIVVLGAGLSRSGRPGYALTRRSRHAAELWQAGYADNIICTGGIAENQIRSEAQGCQEVLMRSGVPQSAILLEEHSTSTEENALFSLPIAQQNNIASIIIVSDSYHLFRAHYIFQTIGFEQMSLSPVSRHLIRGYPSYQSSVIREVLALHWQVFKTTFNIPITSL